MPLIPYAIALVIGMFLGYLITAPQGFWIVLISASLILSLVFLKSKNWRFVPLLLCTLFLGAFMMQREYTKLTPLLDYDKTTIEVVVCDTPKQTEWGILFSAYVVTDDNITLKGKKIRCSWNAPLFIPSIGQTLLVKGRITGTITNDNFEKTSSGNFNYERWLMSHSYVARISSYDDCITNSKMNRIEDVGFIDRIAIKAKILRQHILTAFEKEGLEGEDYAIVAAMSFGDKSALTEHNREVFSQTGAAHLLALSGMHLGILYVLLSMLFSRLRMFFFSQFESIEMWSNILVISTIWLYVILVGMPLSVVRSAMMLTIYTAISTSHRQKMPINTLAFTAIVILIINPMAIWDVGFQMSFLAMVGIFIFNKPIYNIIQMDVLFEHPLLRKIWALICVSVSAQITTMPLSVYYFGRIPILFLLTNIVAIPMVTILLYCVILSLVFWMVPFVRIVLLNFLQRLTSLLYFTLESIARLDVVSTKDISINWVQLMLIYMMIIVLTIIVLRLKRIYRIRRVQSILK